MAPDLMSVQNCSTKQNLPLRADQPCYFLSDAQRHPCRSGRRYPLVWRNRAISRNTVGQNIVFSTSITVPEKNPGKLCQRRKSKTSLVNSRAKTQSQGKRLAGDFLNRATARTNASRPRWTCRASLLMPKSSENSVFSGLSNGTLDYFRDGPTQIRSADDHAGMTGAAT